MMKTRQIANPPGDMIDPDNMNFKKMTVPSLSPAGWLVGLLVGW
jgi:hypothetical protein